MTTAERIGSNIQAIMKKNAVTSVQLAQHLSISRQTLMNYLRGMSTPDCIKLIEIADFFQMPVQDILYGNDHSQTSVLFRSALNYSDALSSLDTFSEYIDIYKYLTTIAGDTIHFFPEYYDFPIQAGSSQTLTKELKRELELLAKEQRQKIDAGNTDPLHMIALLEKRGINICFFDFQTDETFGLSAVDGSYGCFIFVNSNKAITLERMIFTVFHEYAHLLLHRSYYKKMSNDKFEDRAKFLDKMANYFASCMLVPRDYISAHEAELQNITTFDVLISLKQELQVSLSSLVLALQNYGYWGRTIVNQYFQTLRELDFEKQELYSLSDSEEIQNYFNSIKNVKLKRMLKTAYANNRINLDLICFLLSCSPMEAIQEIQTWKPVNNTNKILNLINDELFH